MAAAVVLTLLHRALEGIVCSSGDIPRRKLVWDIATAAVLTAALMVAWGFVLLDTGLRQRFGTLLFISTLPALAAIGAFAHMSRLAYERGEFDGINQEESVAAGPDTRNNARRPSRKP